MRTDSTKVWTHPQTFTNIIHLLKLAIGSLKRHISLVLVPAQASTYTLPACKCAAINCVNRAVVYWVLVVLWPAQIVTYTARRARIGVAQEHRILPRQLSPFPLPQEAIAKIKNDSERSHPLWCCNVTTESKSSFVDDPSRPLPRTVHF